MARVTATYPTRPASVDGPASNFPMSGLLARYKTVPMFSPFTLCTVATRTPSAASEIGSSYRSGASSSPVPSKTSAIYPLAPSRRWTL